MWNLTNDQIVKSKITINEIMNQPECWEEILNLITIKEKEKITSFLTQNHIEERKIILTGAGSSEFVGNALFSYLKLLGYNVESIATTDIVSNPQYYFNGSKPTLLVSFARSGNSPESLAAVNLANQLQTNLKHLIITCNKDGQLATNNLNNKDSLLLVLPEKTNDQGFAMTASYTSMLIACALIFCPNKYLFNFSNNIKSLIKNFSELLKIGTDQLYHIASNHYERIIFLGANTLKGYAQESALKILELTAGKTATFFNSPVGFRHGPKAIINNNSLVFCFLSQNQYTRKYDLDLLKEIKQDAIAKTIVVFDANLDQTIKPLCDYYFATTNNNITTDLILGIQYLVLAQIFAVFQALSYNNSPDNPAPNKVVNRVVKGVNIYQYEKKVSE